MFALFAKRCKIYLFFSIGSVIFTHLSISIFSFFNFQVFICGHYPHWLFMTQRGSLRIHPMGIDGAITCFAPFHNINCPKGFLYFNKQGELRISVLPTHLTYDAPWPIRKVPLRCSPHFVAYHVDSKVMRWFINLSYIMK